MLSLSLIIHQVPRRGRRTVQAPLSGPGALPRTCCVLEGESCPPPLFRLQLCVPGENRPRQRDGPRPQPLLIPDPGKVREERGPKPGDPSVLSPV